MASFEMIEVLPDDLFSFDEHKIFKLCWDVYIALSMALFDFLKLFFVVFEHDLIRECQVKPIVKSNTSSQFFFFRFDKLDCKKLDDLISFLMRNL